MDTPSTPRGIRLLVIVAIVCLTVSILLSGLNVFTSLAAPLRQTSSLPGRVGFEGQLLDGSTAVPDGPYSLTFKLYDTATGGTELWSETQTVTVTNGLYSVYLGSTANNELEPADFAGQRWLEITWNDADPDPITLTPRIQIGAVPYSLNTMGLQGRPVSSNAPQSGNVLGWSTVSNNWQPLAIDTMLDNSRYGVYLRYLNSTSVEVSAGELMVTGRIRQNGAPTTISFSGTPGGPNRGLDSGVAAADTVYYVYAAADDDEATFDVIVSANASQPTGITYYQKLGWLITEPGSTNIHAGSVTNVPGPGHTIYEVVSRTDPVTIPYNTNVTVINTLLPAYALSDGIIDVSFVIKTSNFDPTNSRTARVTVDLGTAQPWYRAAVLTVSPNQTGTTNVELRIGGLGSSNSQTLILNEALFSTASQDRTQPLRLKIAVFSDNFATTTVYPVVVTGIR